MYFVWQSLDRFLSLRQLAVVSFYARPMPSRVFRAPHAFTRLPRPIPSRVFRPPHAFTRLARSTRLTRLTHLTRLTRAPMSSRVSRAPHAFTRFTRAPCLHSSPVPSERKRLLRRLQVS